MFGENKTQTCETCGVTRTVARSKPCCKAGVQTWGVVHSRKDGFLRKLAEMRGTDGRGEVARRLVTFANAVREDAPLNAEEYDAAVC